MVLDLKILRKIKRTKVRFNYKYTSDFGLNNHVYGCALENVDGS